MKKLMNVLLAASAVFALTLSTTFALPSATANGSVVGEATINGEVVEGTKVLFETSYEGVSQSEQTKITQLNAGTAIAEVLDTASVQAPAGLDVSSLKLLTQIQDLVVRDANGNLMKDAKNVKVTWEVPNLTNGLGDAYVIHYSTVRNVWEIIKPDQVDFSKKTITATFADLSPVGVVYVPSTSQVAGNKDDSSSVQTSDQSNIALYAGVAVVALVAIAGLVYKTKKQN